MKWLDLGWDPQWYPHLAATTPLARISSVHRGFMKGISPEGEINILLPGKYLSGTSEDFDFPVTGDWVTISPPFDDVSGKAVLLGEVLPRRTQLSRWAPGKKVELQPIAANVDVAFIVTSANGDLNLNRLDRYLLICRAGGVVPIILLSKSDLGPYPAMVCSIEERQKGITVLPVSAHDGRGMEDLRNLIKKGKTYVFLGSSGVGKSTLVNQLMGKEIQLTQTARENDDRGRHTTTSRQLLLLSSGGILMDTPGMRELQVVGGEESLKDTFGNIDQIMTRCRFTNCTHGSEPGCAVQEALVYGEITEGQMKSYLKLQKELAHGARKQSRHLANEEKKKWKKIHQDMKKRKKFEKFNE